MWYLDNKQICAGKKTDQIQRKMRVTYKTTKIEKMEHNYQERATEMVC